MYYRMAHSLAEFHFAPDWVPQPLHRNPDLPVPFQEAFYPLLSLCHLFSNYLSMDSDHPLPYILSNQKNADQNRQGNLSLAMHAHIPPLFYTALPNYFHSLSFF